MACVQLSVINSVLTIIHARYNQTPEFGTSQSQMTSRSVHAVTLGETPWLRATNALPSLCSGFPPLGHPVSLKRGHRVLYHGNPHTWATADPEPPFTRGGCMCVIPRTQAVHSTSLTVIYSTIAHGFCNTLANYFVEHRLCQHSNVIFSFATHRIGAGGHPSLAAESDRKCGCRKLLEDSPRVNSALRSMPGRASSVEYGLHTSTWGRVRRRILI
jgi:hypothetical protein